HVCRRGEGRWHDRLASIRSRIHRRAGSTARARRFGAAGSLVTAPPRRRVLVVPAAGRGSRLGGSVPKALVEVAGRPMLAWLLSLYRPWIAGLVVVAHPS